MTRMALLRQRAHRMARKAGKPVLLLAAEVVAIRKALGRGEEVHVVAERHGLTPRRVRSIGRTNRMGATSPPLDAYVRELRERRATLNARQLAHVRGIEDA